MILDVQKALKRVFPLLFAILFFSFSLPVFFVRISTAQDVQSPVFENYDFEQILDAETRTMIENAIPAEASVSPSKKRKLLVVTLNVRDGKVMRRGHPSIPLGNYAIKLLGERTGAYETVFCNDTLVFQPDYLAQFDALCFNNTVGVLFNDPMMRRGLLEYVYSGKGFIGFHAAGATFVQFPVYDQFPPFGEMLGGYENGGHPWGPRDTIAIKIDDPENPVNRAFSGRGFEISDEVFQFKDFYSRDKLRILISIDADKTDVGPNRRILAERRKDLDFGMSWIKNYGRGRVFYTSFGHNNHIFWNDMLLEHFLDGIQFALGDLTAPTTPSNKLTDAIRAQEKLNWRLGLTAYTFKDNTLFETIDKAAELGMYYIEGLNVQKVSAEINKNFDQNLGDEELFAIKEKLLDKGVRIVTVYIHSIPGDETECRKIFEFGRKMGIETFISEPLPEALNTIEKFCDEYDINLAIHNHGEKMSPHSWHPEKILELCRNRSRRIGACGDMGYWVRSGISPLEAVKLLKDRLITIQMHDLNELSADAHDVPWGQGVCGLSNVLRELKNSGVSPTVFGLEYSYNWGSSLPEIKACKRFFDSAVINLAGK